MTDITEFQIPAGTRHGHTLSALLDRCGRFTNHERRFDFAFRAFSESGHHSFHKVSVRVFIRFAASVDINDGKQVIAALGELGELIRVGDDYMSVTLLNDDVKLRLKGVLFDSRFDAQRIRATDSASITVAGAGRESPNLEAAEVARKKLDAAVFSRAAYNRKTYQCALRSLLMSMN